MSEKQNALVFKRQIPAPPEDVFYAFSTEQGWRNWLCDSARFRPLSGRNYQLSWDRGWFAAGGIQTLDRPRMVELTWHGLEDPATSGVSIQLRARDGGTEVEIRHTALGEGADWERARAEASRGWEMGLENLESIFTTGEDLRVIRRPMLGIMLNDFTKEIAADIGVPVTQGVRIDRTVEGMGAERAGLTHDDVVIEMDGKGVKGFADLGQVLQGHQAGDTVPVTIYRGSEKMKLDMELSRRPIPPIPLDPAELADQVKQQHEHVMQELRELFDGVSEDQAGLRPEPEGWSAKDTLAHLIEAEYRNLDAIQELMQDTAREFPDDGANVRLRFEAMRQTAPTVEDLLRELARRQQETQYMLRHADQLKARKGAMWQLGRGWLEVPLLHEHNHMEQMRAAIEAAVRGVAEGV